MVKVQLQEDIGKFQETKKEFEQSICKLDTAEKQINDSQVFVLMKKCQKRLTEQKKLHAAFKTLTKTLKLEYDINNDIEKSLKKFATLGSVKDQHLQPALYTVKGQHTMRVCQDGHKCLSLGSCQLPDGSFLVTDFSHKKIVRLDSSCSRISDQCPVPGHPYAVCLIGDMQAAVSLWDSKTIQFVSLETKLTLTRSIKLQHHCRGLFFSMGELFISDGGKEVYVYDTAGNQLRTLGTSPQGPGNVFNGTDHIAVSADGQKVFVSDDGIGLVCVDREGKHLFTYRNSQLEAVCGVCIDDCGSVFVCDYTTHVVLQLSEDGMMLGVLLQQSSGVNQPYSVCFDSKNKRLLVTKNGDSSVSVYDLE